MSPSVCRLFGLAMLAAPALSSYVLQDDYNPSNFFDQFTFFDTDTQTDPTGGNVRYLPKDQAESTGLVYTTDTNAFIRVDNSTLPANTNRSSVRIQSSNVYNHGLFILDLDHMPHGCGVWPAYWLLGPNWPFNGEIDIIENINQATSDLSTLHTSDNCNLAVTGAFTGTAGSTLSCAYQPGCGIDANNDASYGIPFNNNGGGVYATEWNSDAISIWFFPRGSIPGDISSGAPTVQGWGPPQAQFYKSGCDIDAHFKDLQIIFNTELCGDWAGNQGVWSSSSCGSSAPTCADYVANVPSAFTAAYWSIRSLKVYVESTTAADRAAPPKSVGNQLFIEKEQ